MSSTPKYEHPPVVETVLGVQFPELSGFRCAHFGLYWQRIKDRFPVLEDKARLKPAVETFPRKLVLPEAPLQFLPGGVPERVWYVGKPPERLIQVQANRFLFNWRGFDGGGPYPSYEKNRDVFLVEFAAFSEFCLEHDLDKPSPELCEVTYINHIEPEDGETVMELFGKVFTGLRWEFAGASLGAPENATLNRVFVIPGSAGRLYAQAGLAYHGRTRRELIRFELTARVNHPSQKRQDLPSSMQLAHNAVVNGFASMTNPDIQSSRWRRKQ